jgi:hypothetical protein
MQYISIWLRVESRGIDNEYSYTCTSSPTG